MRISLSHAHARSSFLTHTLLLPYRCDLRATQVELSSARNQLQQTYDELQNTHHRLSETEVGRSKGSRSLDVWKVGSAAVMSLTTFCPALACLDTPFCAAFHARLRILMQGELGLTRSENLMLKRELEKTRK
jgi:hypothetical protein